jgi:hypothetical protein
VEDRRKKAEEACGEVFVSNTAELMYDWLSIKMPDNWLKHSAVILNLGK